MSKDSALQALAKLAVHSLNEGLQKHEHEGEWQISNNGEIYFEPGDGTA